MKRITKFYRGYDCINFECINDSNRCYPGGGGSHGLHGLEIVFYINGEKGAVYFTLSTGWLPKSEPADEYIDFGKSEPYPVSLGYISKEPLYSYQEKIKEKIDFLDIDGYYSGYSSLDSKDAFYSLVNGGDDALWNFLEQYYRHMYLEGFDYPKRAEYPKRKRKS